MAINNYSLNAKSPKWTKEEIEKLKSVYRDYTYKDLSIIFDRSVEAISQKLSSLGYSKYNKWTEEEINLLKKKYNTSSTEQLIILFPAHTLGSINKKAEKYNLKRQNIKRPKWTDDEIGTIQIMYEKGFSVSEISKKINRSEIVVNIEIGSYKAKLKKWTAQEEKILLDNYKTLSYKEISNLLSNKSLSQVKKYGKKLNLNKIDPRGVWTAEEEKLLIEKYSISTIEELMNIFKNKAKSQISKKAKHLRLRKTKKTLSRCFRTKIDNYNDIVKIYTSSRQRWRKIVLKRDNYTCVDCNLKDITGLILQIHHIIPVRSCSSKEQIIDIKNGITLCIDCHNKVTGREYKFIEKYQNLVEL